MEIINRFDNMVEEIDPYAVMDEVTHYEQPNPFYLSYEGSDLRFIKSRFLKDSYSCVFIICLSNNYSNFDIEKIKMFHLPSTTVSDLLKMKDLISIVRAPFSLVNLTSIRNGLISIDGKFLSQFSNNYEFYSEKELVFLMLETTEEKVRSWLTMYEPKNNIDDFIEKKIFTSYYRLNREDINDKILKSLESVNDFRYWMSEKNCRMSFNDKFSKRSFNLSFMEKWGLPLDDIEREFQKILQNFDSESRKIPVARGMYPNDIINGEDKSMVNDNEKKFNQNPFSNKALDCSVSNDKNFFYKIDKEEDLVIDRDMIEELLVGKTLNEKEKYYLISNFLISKKYCHYVINNKNILSANKHIFTKYGPAMRYFIGYAWVCLYKEEAIRKTKCQEKDRFVFDLDTASLLPSFPFNHETPFYNPYFSCTLSENLLNMPLNINGVRSTFDYQQGLVNLSEFRHRLNIFMTGDSSINLLEGIDWSNMAITGGVMAAIIPKLNPLMELFKNTPGPDISMTDDEYNRFFREYYSNSDIDIACNHENILDFIEHVKNLKNTVHKNLMKINKNANIKMSITKSLCIFIGDKMLKEKCDNGEIPFGYDFIINNKDKHSVKFYFYEMYLEKKSEVNKINKGILGTKINDDEYFGIIDYCEFDKTVLAINDANFEKENINNRKPENNSGIELQCYVKDNDSSDIFIKFSETMKYTISSKDMNHPFEVFRINSTDFMSCISKFHLPCVRSYYNGSNCYILPSAITAYQTLTNIDFKYFVGSQDPINIINKYRGRGYGTILNNFEIKQFLSYILSMNNLKKAYNVSGISDVKDILGSRDVEDILFKPMKHSPETFPSNIVAVPQYSKVNIPMTDDLSKYSNKYPKGEFNLYEKKIIHENGQIIPVKRWYIDAFYDLLK